MNNQVASFEQSVQRELARVIVGAEDVIRALCIALIARGHVLVQGPPGLGKTLLAKTLARVLGGEFKRVQGTADLMPSDIVGTHIFDASKNEFVFRRGPLFADVLLVDEINRTGPKTQSALLEAMEERQVSSERDLYPLPEDFLVLATQNPRDFEGTYPLPESQLDRFMLRIDMTYPERAAEGEILRRYGTELEARDAIPADLGGIDRALLHAGARRGERAARLGGAVELRARSRAGDARASARLARAVDTRRAGADPRGACARGPARRGIRGARRRAGRGALGAGTSPGAQARSGARWRYRSRRGRRHSRCDAGAAVTAMHFALRGYLFIALTALLGVAGTWSDVPAFARRLAAARVPAARGARARGLVSRAARG